MQFHNVKQLGLESLKLSLITSFEELLYLIENRDTISTKFFVEDPTGEWFKVRDIWELATSNGLQLFYEKYRDYLYYSSVLRENISEVYTFSLDTNKDICVEVEGVLRKDVDVTEHLTFKSGYQFHTGFMIQEGEVSSAEGNPIAISQEILYYIYGNKDKIRDYLIVHPEGLQFIVTGNDWLGFMPVL